MDFRSITREEHEDARQIARDIAKTKQYEISMKLRISAAPLHMCEGKVQPSVTYSEADRRPTGTPESYSVWSSSIAFELVADWVAAARAHGAIVTSVCSGALLLGAAGLLDGREATTHWICLAGAFRR